MPRLSLEDILASAGALFQSECLDDLRFKVKAFLILSSADMEYSEGEFDRIQILAMVEDFAGFRTGARIWELVWQLGLFESGSRPGLYRRVEKLYLHKLFSAPPSDDGDNGFNPQIFQDLSPEVQSSSNGVLLVFRQSRAAWEAIIRIFDLLDRDKVPLPPPFLTRAADGELSRLSPHPSITTAADIFTLLVDLPSLIPALAPSLTQDILTRAETMLVFCAGKALPAGDDKGDGGALQLPTDEDFPGANRPTVPANALFVIAACLGFITRLDRGDVAPNDYMVAVPGCVRFLLRMQSQRGGWGVYAYDPALYGSKVPMPEEPFFTTLVVTALALALKGLDEDLRRQCRVALQRCANFLSDVIVRVGEAVTWTPSFDPDGQPDAYATAQAASALLRIAALAGDVPDAALRDLAFRALDGLADLWRLGSTGKANQDRIRFRSPTCNGASGVVMTWEQPGHAKIVSALTNAYLNDSYHPSPLLWDRIEQAVTLMLAEEDGGFWCDYGLEDKINLPNSANCALALGRYLAAVRRLLSEGKD
jgi:hypothetical protein